MCLLLETKVCLHVGNPTPPVNYALNALFLKMCGLRVPSLRLGDHFGFRKTRFHTRLENLFYTISNPFPDKTRASTKHSDYSNAFSCLVLGHFKHHPLSTFSLPQDTFGFKKYFNFSDMSSPQIHSHPQSMRLPQMFIILLYFNYYCMFLNIELLTACVALVKTVKSKKNILTS